MLTGFPVIEIVSLARACLTRDESFGCASNRKHPGFQTYGGRAGTVPLNPTIPFFCRPSNVSLIALLL